MEFLSKTMDSSGFKNSVYDNYNHMPIIKSKNPVTLNNLSDHGYTVPRNIKTTISISRPKNWPEKNVKEDNSKQ